MIEFNTTNRSQVILEYTSEDYDARWLWHIIREKGRATIGKVFKFDRGDLLDEPTDAELEDDIELERFVYRFRFAQVQDGYYHIEGRHLDIPNPVLIGEGVALSRKLFSAHRDISIFRRVAGLIEPGQPIAIGGDREEAIPVADFERLLTKFPSTGELNRYADARVADVLGEYFDGMKDARRAYEQYLNRRMSILEGKPLETDEILETELEKYLLIRKAVADWLNASEVRTERDWQRLIITFLLLIFPKYVAILQNVRIADTYSRPGMTGYRDIDIALVDAAGNLDIIEIKKPHEVKLLAATRYRDNRVPSRELTGTIMQAEKYLFHLSKWGMTGEQALTTRYRAQLPAGMEIRITNPKAILILGRDRQDDEASLLDPSLRVDFEVIRRKYANMIDIMTYDDLLRRLDNIIGSLRRRIAEDDDI